MVAPGGLRGCSGGHAWLLLGGACMVARGACVGAPGGMHGCSGRGMHGFFWGVCGFFQEGHAWFFPGVGGHAYDTTR